MKTLLPSTLLSGTSYVKNAKQFAYGESFCKLQLATRVLSGRLQNSQGTIARTVAANYFKKFLGNYFNTLKYTKLQNVIN